jgi:hypothetical protein
MEPRRKISQAEEEKEKEEKKINSRKRVIRNLRYVYYIYF